MLLYFEYKLKDPDNAKKVKQLEIYNSYTALKTDLETATNQGNYDAHTLKIVTFLKNGWKLPLNDGVVDNEFIDKLKNVLVK